MLAIIETLKEFRTILLGHKIKVYTDHKKLTFQTFNTERILQWRMVLKEYGPELIYIKGHDNVVADALSRLELLPGVDHDITPIADVMLHDFTYLYRDELPTDSYPLRMALIHQEQSNNKHLQERVNKPQSKYSRKQVCGGQICFDIIHLDGKIYVQVSLRDQMIQWYHDMLMHPGMTRMTKTLAEAQATSQNVLQRMQNMSANKED